MAAAAGPIYAHHPRGRGRGGGRGAAARRCGRQRAPAWHPSAAAGTADSPRRRLRIIPHVSYLRGGGGGPPGGGLCGRRPGTAALCAARRGWVRGSAVTPACAGAPRERRFNRGSSDSCLCLQWVTFTGGWRKPNSTVHTPTLPPLRISPPSVGPPPPPSHTAGAASGGRASDTSIPWAGSSRGGRCVPTRQPHHHFSADTSS